MRDSVRFTPHLLDRYAFSGDRWSPRVNHTEDQHRGCEKLRQRPESTPAPAPATLALPCPGLVVVAATRRRSNKRNG
jgi:hypothetical protein